MYLRGVPLPVVSSASRQLKKSGFRVDYVEEVSGRLCGAVFLGKTRLIDNVRVR